MKFLILGENSLLNLSSFDKSVFSVFSFVSSIYARQIAAVTPKIHTVKVIERSKDIDFNEECDVVHIHFKTGTAIRTYEIADQYRKNNRTVILSGSHASALPEEAKEHADSVLIGSAEHLWPTVVNDLEKGKLKPCYKSKANIGEKVISSVDIEKPSGFNILGVVEATRGCPYKCDFCQESNVLNGSSFRKRAIEEIIDEIKRIPQKIIFFCDASMTIDPVYTKALFKEMKGLKKRFICEGNADTLARDEELLKLSHEAGCIEWTVGFESFAQETLKNIHKKTNVVNNFFTVVKKIRKYKIAVLGNFMFGFDPDNANVFDFTEENIAKLGLDSARFAIVTPYPGTPLFRRYESEGRILTRDWSKYTRKNVVFEPKNMTAEELKNGFDRISRNFNSISNIISRDVRSLKLGIYPFVSTVGRNIESYISRPAKWSNYNAK